MYGQQLNETDFPNQAENAAKAKAAIDRKDKAEYDPAAIDRAKRLKNYVN